MSRRLRNLLHDDRGLTLPELIVASMLTVVVLVTVGSIYISTIRVERIVADLAEGASSAQLVARSVDAGVRNGVYFSQPPVVVDLSGNEMLVVCTADGGASPGYRWQAWVYDAAARELRAREFPADASPAMPSSAALSTWSLLASGVDPIAATVFTYDEDLDPRRVSVRYALSGEQTDSATIDFSTNLAPAPTYAPGSEPCT